MIARRIKPILLAAAATAALGTAASATPNLPPNSVLSPVPAGSVAGETLLADILNAPFTGKNFLGDVTFTGEYDAWVYRNGGGTLDFVTRVIDDAGSADGITQVSLTDYTGFTTDVSYDPTMSSSPIIPVSAGRQASGDTVSFYFMPPAGIGPGDTSADLIIKTNATTYSAGTINMIDGGVTTVEGFAPVPEPGSLALLATGGLPLLGFLRRRKLA